MKKGILVGLAALVLCLIPSGVAGATSYDGTTIQPESDGETYNVSAEAGDTVTLDDAGLPNSQVAVTFKNGVSGSIVVKVSTTKPSDAATAASGIVNVYFDVTLNGITNDDITSATWTFKVAKSWLTEQGVTAENIFLNHYGADGWTRLTTRQVSSTDTEYTFEADVTSFSPFAVTAVEGLSNTGTPYMLGVLIAVAVIAVVAGAFVASRKRHASSAVAS